jgi:hypothetical protein
MKLTNCLAPVICAIAIGATLGCTTTYDRYGRPVQSVDPGVAIAGAAAAGLIGYAIADSNNDNDRYYSKHNHRHYNKRYHYDDDRRHYRRDRYHYY